MRTLLVYCHFQPGVVHRCHARSKRSRSCSGVWRRGTRHRPVRRRASTPCSVPREEARHLEPGPDPEVADHTADLQWCRATRARLPDMVERPAGDAQGMDRPGVGSATSPSTCRESRTGSTPGCTTCVDRPPSRPTARPSSSTRWRARSASARSPARCGRSATRWRARRGSPCTASTPPTDGRAAPSSTASKGRLRARERGTAAAARERARRRAASISTTDGAGSCSPSSTTRCARTSTSGACRASGRSSSRRPSPRGGRSARSCTSPAQPVEAMPLNGARCSPTGSPAG